MKDIELDGSANWKSSGKEILTPYLTNRRYSIGHVQDILPKLPNDAVDDPNQFRQELIRRGVADALIKRQMEDLALSSAARHASAERQERLTSLVTEHTTNATACCANLPIRCTQQEQDQRAGRSHDSRRDEQPAHSDRPARNPGNTIILATNVTCLRNSHIYVYFRTENFGC